MEKLMQFLKEEDGAAGIEYILLASLVALVIIVFFSTIKTGLTSIWSDVNDGVSTASAS